MFARKWLRVFFYKICSKSSPACRVSAAFGPEILYSQGGTAKKTAKDREKRTGVWGSPLRAGWEVGQLAGSTAIPPMGGAIGRGCATMGPPGLDTEKPTPRCLSPTQHTAHIKFGLATSCFGQPRTCATMTSLTLWSSQYVMCATCSISLYDQMAAYYHHHLVSHQHAIISYIIS